TASRSAPSTVVKHSVHGFLLHLLFVVHDDFGRPENHESFEPVVAVDNPTVEIVEVRSGEPATVELHHRTQLRRDHRYRVENHAARVVAGRLERRDDLEPFERAQFLLSLTGANDLAQRLGFRVDVELGSQLLDGLCTHSTGEVLTVTIVELTVERLVHDHLAWLEFGECVPHLVELVELTLRLVANLPHLALAAL